MVRHYAEAPSDAKRAEQIWLILSSKASNRQTITYDSLARAMGYRASKGIARVLGKKLGHVAYYYKQNRIPPLTVIVVREDTGLPGKGYPGDASTVCSDQESVFRFKWFSVVPPTPKELAKAYPSAKVK